MDKKKISFFLIVFTGAMMLFGALGLSLMDHGASHACPFTAATGTDCPQAASRDTMTLHHLEGLNQMTQAIFGGDFLKTFAMVALAGALFFIARGALFSGILCLKKFLARHRIKYKTSSPIDRTLFWSALHNKWGTVAPQRVYELTAIT